ncbi:hypothetical protein OGR47_02945 [Methylocystis sp. MJC1]|uniref:hypothetical protein n=1 Tax=Methylocystis sp. MJC1 TaxID=2654282 RepID=UPI0013EADBE1|nr:hypothetical protein [Methylocystis sp. MJC1]MBU6525970.1 hypothetical protein [Methylocystis sp. MJC1]UZX12437.1 hypothetical protein OGR47_02945 [Methylocystis sp. MJC1]
MALAGRDAALDHLRRLGDDGLRIQAPLVARPPPDRFPLKALTGCNAVAFPGRAFLILLEGVFSTPSRGSAHIIDVVPPTTRLTEIVAFTTALAARAGEAASDFLQTIALVRIEFVLVVILGGLPDRVVEPVAEAFSRTARLSASGVARIVIGTTVFAGKTLAHKSMSGGSD